MKLHLRSVLTWFITLIAVTAAIGVIISMTGNNEDQPAMQRLSIGSHAPDFEGVNTNGEKIRLADYRGKVVVINFWASWCGPCVNEMPLINGVFQDHPDDVATLFVNAGESKGTIKEFLTAHQFEFPVLIDAAGKIAGAYSITGLPATYILNKDGAISQAIIGEIQNKQQLDNAIEDARGD
ncbi:TlpA family protein disulfide reductase [Paenibacillus antibioticophila]|uniref:TlpA family protein disulfide reductase n=1 Tax=Paenibacillus antibioticophila TaxID=1274374 RepID=UPI0005CAD5ED|nr:redoxin domain-containing protein [Paenibacillus antibioticophila]